MRYDIIFIGETPASRKEAIAAARSNQLVALVRTAPLLERLLHEPLETWTFSSETNWSDLRQQFAQYEQRVGDDLAKWGVDLFEGHVLDCDDRTVSVSGRTGQQFDLEAEQICHTPATPVRIPGWLRAEVPQILPLGQLSRLATLPQRILIEGNGIAALRTAVILARLGREVTLSAETGIAPHWDFEANELWEESLHRGVVLIPQSHVLSVLEREGQFTFCIRDGRVLQTDLYLFAVEQDSRGLEPVAENETLETISTAG